MGLTKVLSSTVKAPLCDRLLGMLPVSHPALHATLGSVPIRGCRLHAIQRDFKRLSSCRNRAAVLGEYNWGPGRSTRTSLSRTISVMQCQDKEYSTCTGVNLAVTRQVGKNLQPWESLTHQLRHHYRSPPTASFTAEPRQKALVVRHIPETKLMEPKLTGLQHQQVAFVHSQFDGVKSDAAERYFFLSPKGLFLASPTFMKPYLSLMRFDRPIGTWLLFLPCTFSISMAAPAGHLPDVTMLTLFALGSFFMRGAGCTINDMWDKDFDAKVARTMDRPLACGKISNFQALLFLGMQLSASLAILLTFSWNTVALGAFAMVPCIIYPLMKRITYWPQAFLGLTFNYGVLMGWCAATGGLDPGIVLPLYSAGIAWTLVYDTIYGHQDKDDDILVGLKSTALKFCDGTKPWLFGFSGVMLAGLTTSGIMCDQTWPFYLGVAATGVHLLHQVATVNLNNPEDCGKKFRSNKNLGLMLWAAIVAGTLLKPKKEEEKDTADTVSVLTSS